MNYISSVFAIILLRFLLPTFQMLQSFNRAIGTFIFFFIHNSQFMWIAPERQVFCARSFLVL
jgi:hypothetical protein